MALACGSAVVWQRVPFPLKAAALATAAPLLTPHLYMYEFPILIVPTAFLYRDRAFDRLELIGVAAVNLCLAAYVAHQMPIGPLAVGIVGFLIARRVLKTWEKPLPAQTASVAIAC